MVSEFDSQVPGGEFADLLKIYDQLEAHYKGEKVLHPGHVKFYEDTARRLEERADLLARICEEAITKAVWNRAKPQEQLIAELDEKARRRSEGVNRVHMADLGEVPE